MSGTENAPAPGGTSFQTLARQMEKLPPCQAQCPNSGDVRGWLGVIAQHEKNGLSLDEAYDEAWRMIAERNPLAATIGRICPHPCENLCTRRDKDGAVSINAMERFLGDWALSRSLPLPRIESAGYPESIGVIGSGPASLSFAYQMARRGYDVTIYEQRDKPGGMLRYAIPDYRLPRDVLDAEVQRILNLNISLRNNSNVGGSIGLDELRERHRMVFLGLGAQAARALGIPGEHGPGVIAGIDYLRQRKDHSESLQGKTVIVVGGGNTAIDAARSARRDGADVLLLYRRSEKEMPAVASEVEDARREGVRFRFLAAPTSISRQDGMIRSVEVQNMQLGRADESGRRRPEPVPGQLQDIAADSVIVAVAQAPDWNGIDALPEAATWLRTAADGKLDINLWAGGDDRGPGIASAAIAQGRLAAESAHAELRGYERPALTDTRQPVASGMVKADYYPDLPRIENPRRPAAEWLADPETEIDQTVSYEQACDEAARCMSCGLCFDCQQCFMYCNRSGFARIEETRPGRYFVMALDACEGCGKCIEICPCGYLEPRDDVVDIDAQGRAGA
jgi:formate dehydrogenase major subunit